MPESKVEETIRRASVVRKGTKWLIRFRKPEEDKGGVWYKALSVHTPKEIARKFKKQSVGGVLYETVGRIIGTNEIDTIFHRQIILIQLRLPQHRVEVAGMETCLSEIGIGLLDPVLSGEENGKNQDIQQRRTQ